MTARLYSLSLSHPAQSVRLMLERKRIPHRVVDLQPGLHPVQLRLLGFRGGTVPALRIDGRRLQHSLRISRALDEMEPEPRLFPAGPDARRAVEEAEAWGERELQPVPRRIFRWSATESSRVRLWMAKDVLGMPAPGVVSTLQAPLARMFAGMVGADDDRVRADVAELPALLDHVDALIAAGTIGGEEPNAADFQIATAVRVLLAYEDLHSFVAGRPAEALAMRFLPVYPEPIPSALPPAWLQARDVAVA
jgi:glutathione S-transferase